MEKLKSNCIIVHGCPDNPETDIMRKSRYFHHWMPWTKRELNKRGIQTDTPLIPQAWHPDYQKFKKEFEKYTVTKKYDTHRTFLRVRFLSSMVGRHQKSD